MKEKPAVQAVLKSLSGKLGAKLARRLGRGRLRDIAVDIADYKEQLGWTNTPSEVRRLTDKIRYVPARIGLNLNAVRLSKKDEAAVHAALWRTLKRTFPTLGLRPTN